jgi:hypothetical protein
MSRLALAARLQLLTPVRVVLVPVLALLVSFAITTPLAAVARNNDHLVVGGGVFAVYGALSVMAFQAAGRTLGFAVSLGVTRREHYVGSCLFLLSQALGYGVLLAMLRELERATGGWGLALSFFDVPFVRGGGLSAAVLTGLCYAAVLLAVCAAGTAAGVVHLRWGAVGTAVLAGAVTVVPGPLSWWLSDVVWLRDLISRLAAASRLWLELGIPLVLAVLLLALGWLGTRRAAV